MENLLALWTNHEPALPNYKSRNEQDLRVAARCDVWHLNNASTIASCIHSSFDAVKSCDHLLISQLRTIAANYFNDCFSCQAKNGRFSLSGSAPRFLPSGRQLLPTAAERLLNGGLNLVKCFQWKCCVIALLHQNEDNILKFLVTSTPLSEGWVHIIAPQTGQKLACLVCQADLYHSWARGDKFRCLLTQEYNPSIPFTLHTKGRG